MPCEHPGEYTCTQEVCDCGVRANIGDKVSDPIVGRKTVKNNDGRLSGAPLRKSECDKILEQIEKEDDARAVAIPSEISAIKRIQDGYLRLKDFGWNDAIYCPKDGSKFLVIEAGSTGIHECIYEGEWPKGSWWILADGDMHPSRPILFKPLNR